MIHRPINLEHAAEAMDDRSALGRHSSRPMRHLDADALDEDKPLGWRFWSALAVCLCLSLINAYFGAR